MRTDNFTPYRFRSDAYRSLAEVRTFVTVIIKIMRVVHKEQISAIKYEKCTVKIKGMDRVQFFRRTYKKLLLVDFRETI